MSHLGELKENYFKHFFEALLISLSLIAAATACLIHAIIPFAFKKTASTIMRKILSRTDSRYDR
jgi:hypothetical protein